MASYTFKWEHPEANEVFVTGTFDDWGKTEKLDRKGDFFEKDVQLPNKDKILYKASHHYFVVDGNWTVNSHLPQETDEHNNVNNVLHPHQLGEPSILSSSVAPLATTAGLAGAVPLASAKDAEKSVLPGSFPETPAGEPSSFSVSPIPATDGPGNPIHLEPGEKVPDPSTLTKNTIQSTVASDEPAAFSVAPLPATEGAGNPIHLQPGQKVPDPKTFTNNTIHSGVTDENSAVSNVPEIVTKSQEAAKASPEASANPEALEEKKEFEEELKAKVPEEPPTSEGGISTAQMYGALAGSVTAMGAAAAGAAAVVHKHATTGATEASKSLGSTSLMNSFGTGPNVPDVVKDSIAKAHVSPEATRSTDAVKEKDAVEAELLATIKPSESMEQNGAVPKVVKESIAAAHVSPEATTSAEAVEEKGTMETELLKKVEPATESGEPAPTVTASTSPKAPEASDTAFGVSPLPATAGAGNPVHIAPGEKVPDPGSITTNTLTSNVHTDKAAYEKPDDTPPFGARSNKGPDDSEPAFGVAPLPATAGAGNPVHLAPGEKVPEPSSFTGNTLTSNVHVDKDSYEKSDALPIAAAAASEKSKESSNALSVPPVSKNMIPESSLPMGIAASDATDPGVTIQSAAPTSTTAILAGQVPLEPKAKSSAAASGLSSTALESSEPLKSSSEPDGLNAPASAPAVSEVTKENVKPQAVSPVESVKKDGPSVISGTSTSPVATKTTGDSPATPKKAVEAGPSTNTEATGTPGSDVATPDSKAAKKSKRRSIFNKLKKIFD
ncbi:hypothetical protein FKW77_000107 [Venturia effusa]|uniref:AMP-activated protein kinase glycogen-binding domain-containing protein n=1 Tax=Venturia effusa TaxID=50376 RepID=A0A517L4M2_9PEZI|nr:hypothetical protein FKW77_000107 [Venturia effusa]